MTMHFETERDFASAMLPKDVRMPTAEEMNTEQQRDFIKAVGQFIVDQIAPLQKRIAELEDGALKYRGIYQRALSYRRGSCVTHQGALWIAVADADQNQIPATAFGQCWQLAVKSR